MKKILYIISHGHTARGLLQTNLISKLNKNFEVNVICKSENYNSLISQVKSQGGVLHFIKILENKVNYFFTSIRSHINQDIRDNPALWEKHLKKIKGKNTSLKRKIFNKSLFLTGKLVRKHSYLIKIFKRIDNYFYSNSIASNFLQKLKPDLIISTRPVDDFEIYLLVAAKKLNINIAYYILSWDNITSKGFFPVDADKYLVWGKIMFNEVIEFYNPGKSNILLTGVTHFDIHHDVISGKKYDIKYLEEIGIDINKPYILFTMGASYFSPTEIDIVEFLANLVNQNKFGPDIQLVIRPHMANFMSSKSDVSWIDRLHKIKSERIILNFPKQKKDLLTWYMSDDDMLSFSNIINGASVVINSGSTVAIESIIHDKPTIITLFDFYPTLDFNSITRCGDYIHLKKLFSLNGCRLAKSKQELVNLVSVYLKNPKKDHEFRLQTIKEQVHKNDGKSTNRFVENIKNICNV